ncbi:MAG: hypothetical protein ACUVXA_03270, partial [Candidatus Jordarchaeum sp.]|uniref:hypothetical protein n=1 Tax=Candidatus Jordarchaeum sp. TaxID=2823881 RepID=UPI00404AA623
LHRKYGSLETDEDLVSGFLSALSDFGRNISGKELESVIFSDKKFVSMPSEHLIFVSYSDTEDDVKDVLKEIKDAFVDSYGSILWWTGNRDAFQEFLPKLDKIVGTKGKEGKFVRSEAEEILNKLKEGKISPKEATDRTLEYYIKKLHENKEEQ